MAAPVSPEVTAPEASRSSHSKHVGLLAVVLLVLLVLTAASYGTSLAGLGPFEPPVALSIAAVKVFLVVWFFMHLREANVPARIAFTVMLGFIAILCLGIASDVGTR